MCFTVSSQCIKPIDPQKECFCPQRCLDANSHKLLRLRLKTYSKFLIPRAAQINTYTHPGKIQQLNGVWGWNFCCLFSLRELPKLFLWCPACQSVGELVSVWEVCITNITAAMSYNQKFRIMLESKFHLNNNRKLSQYIKKKGAKHRHRGRGRQAER